jgi:hypothetical protein
MVFFFFGGVDTEYKLLQRGFGPCLVRECGQGAQVDLVEAGYKLNAFFIPIPGTFARKQMVRCRSCGYAADLATYDNHKAACMSKNESALPKTPPSMATVQKVSSHEKDGEHREETVKAVLVLGKACVHCGTLQQKYWAFCPHCGNLA